MALGSLLAGLMPNTADQGIVQRYLVTVDERVVGEEFEGNARAIKRIRLAMQRAINANRAFVTGRTSAVSKISMALAEREIER